MSEERGEKPGGVIAGMLRSLEGEQTAGIAPVMPEMEVDVHQAGHEGDDVLETEREFNYEGYQVVRREFFAHINEPSVTFNNYKFYVNAACLNRFPKVDYVQVLVNQESKILAILSGRRPGCLRLVYQWLWQTKAEANHLQDLLCQGVFSDGMESGLSIQAPRTGDPRQG